MYGKKTNDTRNKDLNLIQNILKSMGVEYDPAIVPQLLSFAYDHASNIVDRAQKLAMHDGRRASEVGPADVSQTLRSGSTGVTYRNVRSGIFTAKRQAAFAVNKKPIPRISTTWSVYLPKKAAPAKVPLFDNYIVNDNHTSGRKKETDIGFQVRVYFESFD